MQLGNKGLNFFHQEIFWFWLELFCRCFAEWDSRIDIDENSAGNH